MAEATAVTCESRETLIALLVEGDLEGADHAALETHLAACARCRKFAADLTRSQGLLKDLGQADLDAGALAEVRYRVRESLERPRATMWPAWALAAAAMVVVAVLVARRVPVAAPDFATTVEVTPTQAPGPTATVAAVPLDPPPPTVAEHRSPPPPTTPARGTWRRSTSARHATITVEPPLPSAPDTPPTAVVKLKTSDPDVVIYWVDDSNGGQS